jgi:hypothetical protein
MTSDEHEVDLVGAAETAELLAITRSALWERRHNPGRWAGRLPPFPKPVAELRCGPIWLRSQIEDYRQASEDLSLDRALSEVGSRQN